MDKNLQRMLSDIDEEVKYTRSVTGRDSLDPAVIDALTRVPRDRFVPEGSQQYAFDNGPLSIGHGQTISQPYIVALMTELLELQKTHRVLEIGTGSGYQTAILSLLCREVYTVELIDILSREADKRLREMGYDNVRTYVGNGYEGLPDHAPYDRIIVTAAATHIPDDLIVQLNPGGRLVIPVGQPYSHQDLLLVTKNQSGDISRQNILPVAFVPLRHDFDD